MMTDTASSANSSANEPGNGFGSALLAMSREWTDFIGQRVKHDAELVNRLTTCKDPTEVLRTYSEFWVTAAEEYNTEAAKIAKLSSAIIPAILPISASTNGQVPSQPSAIAATSNKRV
jgi:Phasin protein